MRLFFTWIQLAMLAVCGQFIAGAADTNSPADPQAAVLAESGAAATDSVQLVQGGEWRGTVLNPSFELHTAYGAVRLDRRLVTSLVFNSSTQPLDSICTVNRNRLSGFVHDTLQFETVEGLKTNLQKHLVRGVTFRTRAPEPQEAHTGQFLVLANGDLLSGEVKLPDLSVNTPAGARAVNVAEVESVRFQSARKVRVQFTDGHEEEAELAAPALLARLDFGPEVSLPVSILKTVYVRSGFVPTEVRRVFDSTVAGETGPPPGVAVPTGLVWVPPGRFLLGSPSDERGRGSDEDPQTEVTLSRGFWMGQHEVTQGEYLAVMGSNPSHFQGNTNQPVERVSWHEAQEYCARLTERARQNGALPAGYVYRLPTEAEWEYACRAGTKTRFSFGDDPGESVLAEYGWFIGNSDLTAHPVGRLKPNPWGLYDMHGNVWEWCVDIWGGAYPGGSVTDLTGPKEGWLRVARGGSWLYIASFSRSANRDNYGPEDRCSDIGFRIILGAPL